MKIRYDVCNKDEASLFCTADDAALCASCDRRVHQANNVASKHQRFSLLYPSSKESPVCDICQEKRAFLFCQQDRAILCSDCDVPIHTANEHTKKHDRFLLAGANLSATSSLYKPSLSSSASLTSSHDSSAPVSNLLPIIKKPVSASPINSNQPSFAEYSSEKSMINKSGGDNDLFVNQGGDSSSSTISEYLIEMLPGWHVEDFLNSSASPFGFCKNDDGVLPYLEADLDSNKSIGSFPAENLGIWVPQAPPTSLDPNQYPSQIGGQTGFFKEASFSTPNVKLGHNNKTWSDDGGLTVPQISPQSFGRNKRSRSFW